MRFSVERFERARLWLGVRAVGLAGLGGVFAVASSFVVMIGLLIAVTADEPGLYGRSPYLVLTIFGGLLPLGLSILGITAGLRRLAALRRLSEMAALASRRPSLSSQDVAESLGLSSDQAEHAVLEAAEIGLVEEEPGDHAPVAAASAARRTRFGRSPADAASCVGAVLNDTYRLEAHLGAGAMGTVFAARHLRTGRACAVKLILPDGGASPDAARRFEREATLAGALGHPGIVAVHDFDHTAEGLPFLVMDLLRGETLERRLLREGSLPFAEARRVALELAAALGAAHAAGLLHRDLKPANVFLAADGAATPGAPPRAVLLDFGLVKRLDDPGASRLTATGAAVGTPLYMSPEQARGEPLDVRSDVYALAVVLFEMVTGAPPFADRGVADVYARLLTEDAPSAGAPDAPAGLDPVLDRALARRREDRFPDARAFAEALRALGG